jgi:L(+)-tartrate dehydratase beta subunit
VDDVVYLTGRLVICRDVAHRRLVELGRALPVDLKCGAIFHAGPIVRQKENGDYGMVSIRPSTSMRMERFEKEFIRQTGVKRVVGKGGMGAETAAGCVGNKAVHAIFHGGCTVLAATKVEKIEGAEWTDPGMPETLWINRVNEFGPLIISIDTKGNNLIEQNKARFNEKRKPILERINAQVTFSSWTWNWRCGMAEGRRLCVRIQLLHHLFRFHLLSRQARRMPGPGAASASGAQQARRSHAALIPISIHNVPDETDGFFRLARRVRSQ